MKKETEFDITRASTLLFDKAEDLYRSDVRGYGRHGSAVHDALKVAFNHLEGGAGTSLFPSGLAACTYPILSQVKTGDHILLTDSSYGPTEYFCNGHLKKMVKPKYMTRVLAQISKNLFARIHPLFYSKAPARSLLRFRTFLRL